MATVTVNPGNCNFTARIEASADADGNVRISLASECPRAQDFAAQAGALSATCAAGWKCAGFFVYEPAAKANLHPACPIPTAVLKALEVAAGLALPQDVVIRFEEAGADG
ncbi:MAG: hypothetical protein JSV65_04025 [Armatimonadota bacterium]|nr:MAG: hypothetical protein JSV65_04025 [Armatimonadota bacterium]